MFEDALRVSTFLRLPVYKSISIPPAEELLILPITKAPEPISSLLPFTNLMPLAAESISANVISPAPALKSNSQSTEEVTCRPASEIHLYHIK